MPTSRITFVVIAFCSVFFIGFISDLPIGRILINELPGVSGGQENISVDDVYLAGAIPEPHTSALGLMVLGAWSLILRRRAR